MEKVANKIDLAQLADIETDTVEYKLALDATPIVNETGTGYRAIMCVPVPNEIFMQNLNLAMLQGQAAAKIAAAMKLDSTAETKH
jgi:hypothetical protein